MLLLIQTFNNINHLLFKKTLKVLTTIHLFL